MVEGPRGLNVGLGALSGPMCGGVKVSLVGFVGYVRYICLG